MVVRLSLAEGDQRRDAGHFVRFEVEPEHLVEQLSRFERFVVHGENARLVRAQLGIEVYADGDRLDFTYPGGQLCQPLVQVAVVFAGGQHVDPLGKSTERDAVEFGRERQQIVF